MVAQQLGLSYGAVSFFVAILHNIFLLYHVDMFVSVYGIGKSSFWLAETVFLVWNSVNDPLFGWLSDRLLLLGKGADADRAIDIVSGRVRTLSWSGPALALAFGLFWVQWLSPGVQLVLCLCVYDSFLTLIDLHHSSLLADLALDGLKRASLNQCSSVGAAAGGFSVFLAQMLWDRRDLAAFRVLCCLTTCVAFLGFLLSISFLRCYVTQHHSDATSSSSPLDCTNSTTNVAQFSKQLLRHKNFIWFSLMHVVQVFHCHFNNNFFPMFVYALLSTNSHSLGSFLMAISFVAPHLNNVYFVSLSKRVGVYTVVHYLFKVKLGLAFVMAILGPDHFVLLCLYVACNRIFTEGTCKLLSLVVTDLIDEDMVLHRRQSPVAALMFGSAALAAKPGQTLAPLLGTLMLSWITGRDLFSTSGSGKMPEASPDAAHDEVMRQACFYMLILVSAICGAVQLLFWSHFTLHGRRLIAVQRQRAGLLEWAV